MKEGNEMGFEEVEMIEDDKKGWGVYMKGENKRGYRMYGDKEDIKGLF